MVKAEGSVVVKVPKKKVWELFKDVQKMPDWMPLPYEVTGIEEKVSGRAFKWKYKSIGIPFKCVTTILEEVPSEKSTTKPEGGINSKWDWLFSSEGENTKVEVKVEYRIPVPLLGKFMENYVVKRGKKDIDHALDNLKYMLESSSTVF